MQRWHRILLFVLVTAASAWLFWYFYNRGHRFFDLKIYMQAVRWWARGNDLYAYAQPDFLQGKLYFTYPPFGAAVLFPFGFLPLGVTEVLFTLGTIAAVIVTTIWIFRALELPLWWTWYAVPLILAMEPLRETIPLGQINMLLVVLVLLDLLVFARSSSKWTGVGIGLATAIKLTPGIFIVYLLLTRQWRAAATAGATAAGVTLLIAAIAPRASWDFWTHALWDTDRVGRTDITGNQSLLGMLHRLSAPGLPNRVIWLVLALAVLAFGLWRAMLAHRAGNEVAALALTGLVGGLVSPITWPHHLYWFVPALAVCLAARRWWLLFVGYLVGAIGVVSLIDYGTALQPTTNVNDFLARNAFVLLSVIFIVFTPIQRVVRSGPVRLT